MRPPEELFSKDFLPNVRGALTHILRKKGYSQSKIASFLNVTQASISHYLSVPLSTYFSRLELMGIPRTDVAALIETLSEDVTSSPVRATQTLISAWHQFLSRGYLCEVHRKMYPELGDCQICIAPEGTTPERVDVLRHLEEAVRIIEDNPLLYYIAPEIGINIAEALNDASSVSDVAAIPGRIVKVKSMLRAVSKPSFGSSHHLAVILLYAHSIVNDFRSVMNVRYDPYVEEALKNVPIPYAFTIHTKPTITEDDIIKGVVDALRRDGSISAVIDRGGIGFEPTTYIFGRDAIEVVKKSVKIARSYVALR